MEQGEKTNENTVTVDKREAENAKWKVSPYTHYTANTHFPRAQGVYFTGGFSKNKQNKK